MKLDIHYIRKSPVTEPDKGAIVDLVNAQLKLGLAPNEIAKLVKEVYFTQEIGTEDRDIVTFTHDVDDDVDDSDPGVSGIKAVSRSSQAVL